MLEGSAQRKGSRGTNGKLSQRSFIGDKGGLGAVWGVGEILGGRRGGSLGGEVGGGR